MKKFRFTIIVLMVYLGSSFCCKAQQKTMENRKFSFDELIFHSYECDSNSSKISMNLYFDRRIELSRQIFTNEGKERKDLKGNFKGYLDKKQFNKIVNIVEKIDWRNLFISDTVNCILPIRTVIISFNGENKKFKSILPPPSTEKLVDCLIKVCSKISLPVYSKGIDFEYIE